MQSTSYGVRKDVKKTQKGEYPKPIARSKALILNTCDGRCSTAKIESRDVSALRSIICSTRMSFKIQGTTVDGSEILHHLGCIKPCKSMG